jgi:DNA uptake protein ComE-like DNA-binding protein
LAWSAARPSFALGEVPAVDSRRVEAAHEWVNPNTASFAALRRLPGLGPVRVQAILEYRRASGQPAPFRSLRDLENIRGIGPITAEGLKEYLEFTKAP